MLLKTNYKFKIIYLDDFGGIFEKPYISKSKFKETQKEKKNEDKFFEEIKSPLELPFEYIDKASEKRREDWNDFENFEEFPNNEKLFTKPGKEILEKNTLFMFFSGKILHYNN